MIWKFSTTFDMLEYYRNDSKGRYLDSILEDMYDMYRTPGNAWDVIETYNPTDEKLPELQEMLWNKIKEKESDIIAKIREIDPDVIVDGDVSLYDMRFSSEMDSSILLDQIEDRIAGFITKHVLSYVAFFLGNPHSFRVYEPGTYVVDDRGDIIISSPEDHLPTLTFAVEPEPVFNI